MMSLTMMGLDPGPLVRALFHFTLMNPLIVLVDLLVVFMLWGLAFVPTVIESIGDVVTLVVFVPKGVDSKGG